MSNAPGRTDWAEDEEADLASAIPAPQRTKNKDGTETIVTIFLNEEGKKVKRTQRLRTITKRIYEKPGVAERKQWPKMGIEAGRAPGPHSDTTTLGENIIFRPQVGYKSGAAEVTNPEEDKKTEALKKMQIKCRICSGDHFTTKCPFKDTMAPEGEAGAGIPDLSEEAGSKTLEGLGSGMGTGPGGSSYVPPHMRKGGAGAGERMGGKFERDDLATLRVTNVSRLNLLFWRHSYTNSQSLGLRIRRRRRAPRSFRTFRSRHSCLPCKGPRDWQGKGFRFRFFRRPLRCCISVRKDGRFRLRSLDSPRRVR